MNKQAIDALERRLTEDQNEEFSIYAEGLCSASVCSSLPQVEVEERMAAHYTGISSNWELSKSSTFSTGELNPHPCEEKPLTHLHYLFVC